MSIQEFNEKYAPHLKESFYGLAIDNKEVIEYLDKEFTKEIEVDPDFEYSQIKCKMGTPRVHSNSTKNVDWEYGIEEILTKNT